MPLDADKENAPGVTAALPSMLALSSSSSLSSFPRRDALASAAPSLLHKPLLIGGTRTGLAPSSALLSSGNGGNGNGATMTIGSKRPLSVLSAGSLNSAHHGGGGSVVKKLGSLGLGKAQRVTAAAAASMPDEEEDLPPLPPTPVALSAAPLLSSVPAPVAAPVPASESVSPPKQQQQQSQSSSTALPLLAPPSPAPAAANASAEGSSLPPFPKGLVSSSVATPSLSVLKRFPTALQPSGTPLSTPAPVLSVAAALSPSSSHLQPVPQFPSRVASPSPHVPASSSSASSSSPSSSSSSSSSLATVAPASSPSLTPSALLAASFAPAAAAPSVSPPAEVAPVAVAAVTAAPLPPSVPALVAAPAPAPAQAPTSTALPASLQPPANPVAAPVAEFPPVPNLVVQSDLPVQRAKDGANSFLLGAAPGQRYHRLAQLGKGGSAVVYKVIRSRDGKEFALKQMDLPTPDADGGGDSGRMMHVPDYLREVESLARFVGDPHVVQLVLAQEGATEDEHGQVSKRHFYMLMECASCDLERHLSQRRRDLTMTKFGVLLPAYEVRTLFASMARAVASIHSRGIIHADLKPVNFVLSASGCVKLIDFGIAKSVDIDAGHTSALYQQAVGTLNFMSPEALCQDEGAKIRMSTDIWSLACMFYALVYGEAPFARYPSAQLHMHKKIARICDAREVIPLPPEVRFVDDVLPAGAQKPVGNGVTICITSPTPECPEGSATITRMFVTRPPHLALPGITLPHESRRAVPQDVRDILRACLQRQADRRPTAAQLLAHPYIDDA